MYKYSCTRWLGVCEWCTHASRAMHWAQQLPADSKGNVDEGLPHYLFYVPAWELMSEVTSVEDDPIWESGNCSTGPREVYLGGYSRCY
jgi:hypothetical protein